ncbi:hypothetical protein [Roseisolibacter sp. H3M3-2]|uniref:hypothetical protein n=1 Tax=Roseisolibacter sp. H3M3-2 TaxID=3031323 RepID=UPI0023DB1BCF|nr:hypothetical protein [Roseisolibacter sp. H3M3-2]MDF1503975.1 hypothetical protein [Roseisolibacter sp. H3M3-2]
MPQPQSPAAPPPPALPGEARVVIGTQSIGVPRNAREMRVLRAQRSEMSSQLSNISSRRKELLRELERAEGPARPGLEARIQLLDERILQLERSLAETGQLVQAAPGEALGVQEPRVVRTNRSGMDRGEVAALGIGMSGLVMFPLAVALAVRFVRRGKYPPPPRASREEQERMLRMEQAIDTIAVEVERISEGQRFVTQLLAEPQREPARQLVDGYQAPR